VDSKEASDINETYLKKLCVGEMIEYKKGHLIEIHRVIDGWIHVFKLHNSQLVTQFVPEVPEEFNVKMRGPGGRHIGL
jgi:hypothetical protein